MKIDIKRIWMHTNAKMIFFCYLAGIVVIGVFWGIILSHSPSLHSIEVSTQRTTRNRHSLAIIPLIESHLSASMKDELYVNPFTGIPRKNTSSRQLVRTPPQTSERKRPPDRPATQTEPKPKPETVNIIYKGIFKRTDGKNLALIEDSKSGKTSFYLQGSSLCGLDVGEITATTVTLHDTENEKTVIQLKKPQIFIGGKRAD